MASLFFASNLSKSSSPSSFLGSPIDTGSSLSACNWNQLWKIVNRWRWCCGHFNYRQRWLLRTRLTHTEVELLISRHSKWGLYLICKPRSLKFVQIRSILQSGSKFLTDEVQWLFRMSSYKITGSLCVRYFISERNFAVFNFPKTNNKNIWRISP